MTKRKVKSYTEEFKRSSAKLATTSDQPISKTARELGVNVNTLHGWVNKYSLNSVNLQLQQTDTNALVGELKQLRKENAHLRQERDITCWRENFGQLNPIKFMLVISPISQRKKVGYI